MGTSNCVCLNREINDNCVQLHLTSNRAKQTHIHSSHNDLTILDKCSNISSTMQPQVLSSNTNLNAFERSCLEGIVVIKPKHKKVT